MEVQNIIKYISTHGGITLDTTYKQATLKNGYMVSVQGFEKTYKMDALSVAELDRDIKKYIEFIQNKKHVYVGLWVDNGVIYLDISKHIKTRHQAVTFGINNKQLSIYDIKNDSYINLCKNVYILYRYNTTNNDIEYIREYNDTNELKRAFNVVRIYDYIIESIDDIKHLLNDEFIIIKDRIPAWEL